MALLKHRKVTLSEFLSLDPFDPNTEYTVYNPMGNIVGRAIGNRWISGGDGELESAVASSNLYLTGLEKTRGKILVQYFKEDYQGRKEIIASIIMSIKDKDKAYFFPEKENKQYVIVNFEPSFRLNLYEFITGYGDPYEQDRVSMSII